MRKHEQNHAYIDGANLHKGTESLGWVMDYARFRIWLYEKYSVTKAYLFIGLIPKHADLYAKLQAAGFILVFKEVVFDEHGRAKGNCSPMKKCSWLLRKTNVPIVSLNEIKAQFRVG